MLQPVETFVAPKPMATHEYVRKREEAEAACGQMGA